MAPCPVCLEEPTSPVTLDCSHQICGACLAQLEDRSRPTPLSQRCPTCRRPLPRVAKAYARAAAALKAADAARSVPKAEQRSLEAAVVALRVVVDVMPDHHDARFGLGLVLKRLGRGEDSVRCFAQCAQDACGAGTRGAPGSAAGVGARALGELVGAYGALGLPDLAEAARKQLIVECRGALRGSPGPAALRGPVGAGGRGVSRRVYGRARGPRRLCASFAGERRRDVPRGPPRRAGRRARAGPGGAGRRAARGGVAGAGGAAVRCGGLRVLSFRRLRHNNRCAAARGVPRGRRPRRERRRRGRARDLPLVSARRAR